MKIRLSLLLITLLCATRIVAQQGTLTDSIRQLITALPDTARLSYLEKRMIENEQNAKRLDYARLLYEEASRQNKETYLADAVYMFARHFYTVHSDSMRYWVKKAEPLFLRLGRLDDICRMKAWDIYLLNREGQADDVLRAVDELKKFSKKNNYPEGIEMADQGMADFYFTNNLAEDAERLYLDVLSRMEKRNAPLIKRMNIIRQLFTRCPDFNVRIKYLNLAQGYLTQEKEKGVQQLGLESPVYAWEYMIHRSYVNAYTHLNKYEEAWPHLQKADSIAVKYDMHRATMEMRESYYFYYRSKGDLQNCMVYLDWLIEYARDRNIVAALYGRLKDKTEILNALGQSKEAYELSKTLVNMGDSISQSDFDKTLAHVRTEYEIERLEQEKQKIENQARRTRMQTTFLLLGCGLLLMVIAGLSYMIYVVKRNRKELVIAKEKAEQADVLKSAFLANMNHEIRTPLNAIVGFSQVLIEEEDKEVRKNFAGIIQHNNELLQRLISDVLDISKIDSNSMTLVYSRQELDVILKEIYDTLLLRMSPGVALVLNPCEPITIDTDRSRLTQILTNLLINAIKHTATGQIRFGYDLTDSDVRFYVEDTGEGMEESQLESIFDRFVQLANGKKGVGLGLAICKGLVTKMGGKIWVNSQKGVGSCFFVQIPKVKPEKGSTI